MREISRSVLADGQHYFTAVAALRFAPACCQTRSQCPPTDHMRFGAAGVQRDDNVQRAAE